MRHQSIRSYIEKFRVYDAVESFYYKFGIVEFRDKCFVLHLKFIFIIVDCFLINLINNLTLKLVNSINRDLNFPTVTNELTLLDLPCHLVPCRTRLDIATSCLVVLSSCSSLSLCLFFFFG